MTKFLITGGNGFVASNLITVLANKSENWINVSSRNFKSRVRDQMTVYDDVHLSKSTNWEDLLLNVDCIIHCAAQVHKSRLMLLFKPNSYEKINKLATINLLEQAEKMNVKHFIFISSIAASKSNRLLNPYARSKYETEQEIKKFCNYSKIKYTILRPPLLYGVNAPGNFKKLIWLAKHIKFFPYPSKLNAIPILFIGNFINFIEKCSCNSLAFGKTFEISDQDKLNIRDLILLICEIFNFKVIPIKIPTQVLKLLNIFGVSTIFSEEQQINSHYSQKSIGWEPPYRTREALKMMSEHV